MSNTEIKEFLQAFKAEMKAEMKVQNTMIDEVIRPKLDEVIQLQKSTNGRVSVLELKEHDRNLYCSRIQDEKLKEIKMYKWRFIGTVRAAAAGASLIMNYGILELLKLVK
jgi:hypothetical protein